MTGGIIERLRTDCDEIEHDVKHLRADSRFILERSVERHFLLYLIRDIYNNKSDEMGKVDYEPLGGKCYIMQDQETKLYLAIPQLDDTIKKTFDFLDSKKGLVSCIDMHLFNTLYSPNGILTIDKHPKNLNISDYLKQNSTTS